MGCGDEQFVEFAAVSFARLSHAGYLMTGDCRRARDAARTALEVAYAQWRRVRHDDPYGYCRTVLAEDLADRWRRPISEYVTGPGEHSRPRRMAEGAIDQRRLGSMLSGLSARERAVLVLSCYFDLPEGLVAQDLHLPIITVRRTASGALGKLCALNGSSDGPAALPGRDRSVPAHDTAQHHGFPINSAARHRRPAMSESKVLRRLMLTTEPAPAVVRDLDGIMAAGRRLRRRTWAARATAAAACLVALSLGVASGDVPGASSSSGGFRAAVSVPHHPAEAGIPIGTPRR